MRHAHVDYDSHYGPDSAAPLSPKGEAEIEWICRYFDAISLDRIISSPYKRTIQTITPLAQRKDIPVEIEAWLREFDDEMFEYTEENLQAYGAELGAHTIANWQRFASADTLESHQQEVYAGLTQQLSKCGLVKRGFLYDGVLERDWSILLCGHVGSLETVAAYFLNLHPIHCLFTMYVENASVSLFEIRRDERLSSEPYHCWLRFWNQSAQ